MPKSSKTLIIDTNLWISYLLGGKCYDIISEILIDESFTIFSCKELQKEINEVRLRPKLKRYFSSKQITDFIKIFNERTIVINLDSKLLQSFPRDPKDAYLLALCMQTQSNLLLSGDKDLLSLNHFHQTQIVSINYFANHFL